MKKVTLDLSVEGTTDEVDTFCEWFQKTVQSVEAPRLEVTNMVVVHKDEDPAQILESLKQTLAEAKAKRG